MKKIDKISNLKEKKAILNLKKELKKNNFPLQEKKNKMAY